MAKTPTYVVWGVSKDMDQYRLCMIAGDPENKGVVNVTEALNFVLRDFYSPGDVAKEFPFIYAETLNGKVRSKLVETSSLA